MAPLRLVHRSARPSMAIKRLLATSPRRMADTENSKSHKIGKSSDGKQSKVTEAGSNAELGVGEMDGASFKIEPLRRTGEDANTTRARLLYQSRKRGTLESDLLMSTFADSHLKYMTSVQMAQYDLFLDENDWDIYYWATQEPPPPSLESPEGAGSRVPGVASAALDIKNSWPAAQSADPGKQPVAEPETDEWRKGQPRSGEWAQTVGIFKPAYRPVPARWKNSEILAMLRRHVLSRSAGGIYEGQTNSSADGVIQSVKSTGGGGMAFMPPVFQTDRP